MHVSIHVYSNICVSDDGRGYFSGKGFDEASYHRCQFPFQNSEAIR